MAGLKGFGRSGKLLLCLLVVLLVSFSYSVVLADNFEGVVISKVETAGNVSISATKILSRARTKVGMKFDTDAVEEDIKRIAEIEGVDNAYYNTSTVDGELVLTLVVLEKNLVRSIEFNGNKKLKTGVLFKQLGFKRGDYLDVFSVRAGVEELSEYYSKKGFAFAKISYDSAAVEYGRAVYNIEEGPRVRLKKVSFVGNRAIPYKEIKRGLGSKARKWWFFPNYYSVKLVNEDIAKIENAYQKKGFLNAEVSAEPVFRNGNSKAELTFKITEGVVYIVDDIQVSGNKVIDSETLTADMKLKRNLAYTEERADFDREKIEGLYREMGYIDAKVSKQRTFVGDQRIKVIFPVEEGQRFRIDKIEIAGNTATQDKVFRRTLDDYDFTPGEWFNAKIAGGTGSSQLENAIKRSTFAQSALITPVGDGADKRDALVSIKEGQTGSILFGAGVGSDDGVVGQLIIEQRNFDISKKPDSLSEFFSGEAFKGAGQRFRIALEPGTEFSRYSVSFTEPYLYDMPIQLDTTASNYTRERESFDEERMKGYVGFRKRFDDGWFRGVSFRLENVDVSEFEVGVPVEITKYKGGNLMAGIRLFTGKSTLDNRYNPSKGYFFDVEYEQVGGDHTFGILGATNRWYKTLHEDLAERKTVLETKIHGATVIGDAPPFERFYGGGNGSIRGFEYRGISPRGTLVGGGVSDDPIGSDWILTANAEVAVPMGYGETVAALFFVDGCAIDTGSIRSSVGIGIQIMIPQWFGPVPMRFELAAPISKDEDDDTQSFSFSVGRLF